MSHPCSPLIWGVNREDAKPILISLYLDLFFLAYINTDMDTIGKGKIIYVFIKTESDTHRL